MGVLDIRDKNNNHSAPFNADGMIELRLEIALIRVAQGIILYCGVKSSFGVSI